jgi:negative regulator of flagellin synthesis FlgM
MQIYGPSHAHGAQNSKGPHPSRNTPGSSVSRPAPADQVEISPAAEAAIEASQGDDIRSDLVARVRSEIAAGTYETPDKLNAALDGLLDELG